MGRGKGMPRRGRGGGRGGGGGAAQPKHVAKPVVSVLPRELTCEPASKPIPSAVVDALSEFRKCQAYFSTLERMNPEYGGSQLQQCWTGVSEETLASIERDSDDEHGFNASLVYKSGEKQPVFIKRIHLLDPINAMEGSYVWPEDGALPAPSELWQAAFTKINDPMNEAYVDALFAMYASKLVESGTSPHWCRSFGTFNGRVEKYMYNITDEYDSLKNRPWWHKHQRIGLFQLCKDMDAKLAERAFLSTEGMNELVADDFEAIHEGGVGAATASEPSNDIVHAEPAVDHSSDEPMRLTKPKLVLKRMSPSSSDDDSGTVSTGADSDDSYEFNQYVEFSNFPVQVTLLERAEDTMDALIDAEDDCSEDYASSKDARWSAWLFQVIAALSVAQYYFGFVHNDLHTNNVMWASTDATYIYYKIHSKGKEPWIMRVPTYGKIMKIIDFGRATFHLPDPGGFFISDAFYPGNDAGTQYNCGSFYDADEGPRVEPNPSFDLARLGVSLLESLYPETPEAAKPVKIMSKEDGKLYPETQSLVYNMIWEWMLDDAGKSILRTPKGEERYPDFDLYRALASDVHRAVPMKQIDSALFAGYKFTGPVPESEKVYSVFLFEQN